MHFSPDIVLDSDGGHEFRIEGDFVHVHHNEALPSALKTDEVETIETFRIRGVAVRDVGNWIISQEN